MNREKKSYIYVFLAVLLWASVAAVGKLALRDMDNIQVLFLSSLMATVGLFFITVFRKKLNLIKKYRFKDYFIFAGMGFVGIFLYHIFLYGGLMLAPAQEAFLVNYTWPIWVVIFASIFLKEKIGLKKISAILLSFFGVYIVVTNGQIFNFSIQHLPGNTMALAGAFSYGLFSILGKRFNYDRTTSMLFYFVFTSLFLIPTIFIFSEIPAITFNNFLYAFWLGLFTNALAFIFWFKALEYGNITKMANIIFLTPFFSIVYIYFLVGEDILFSSIIGLVLIVSGIAIQTLSKKQTKS